MRRAVEIAAVFLAGALVAVLVLLYLKREGPEPSPVPGGAEIQAFERGVRKLQSGEARGAIAEFDQAIRIRPDWPEAYYNRALAWTKALNLQAAMADLDRTIALRRTSREAYYNRGLLRLELGDPRGALGDYDEAINLKSDWSDAYYNRGYAKEKLGDLDGANLDYIRALESAPPDWTHRAKAMDSLNGLKKKVADK